MSVYLLQGGDMCRVGFKLTDEHKEKLRRASIRLGLKPPTLSGSENGNWKGGMPLCVDCGDKLSQRTYTRCKSCARKGLLNPYHQKVVRENGKLGGYRELKKSIRNSFLYRQWRSDVFLRDDFTCQDCMEKGGRLEAHHIRQLVDILRSNNIRSKEDIVGCAELWDINNGLTLCVDCHSKTDSYKGKSYKFFKRDTISGLFIKP